jgi:hypothetical protein
MEKPVWEQMMPEELWKDKNSLCTSFTIGVDAGSGYSTRLSFTLGTGMATVNMASPVSKYST